MAVLDHVERNLACRLFGFLLRGKAGLYRYMLGRKHRLAMHGIGRRPEYLDPGRPSVGFGKMHPGVFDFIVAYPLGRHNSLLQRCTPGLYSRGPGLGV